MFKCICGADENIHYDSWDAEKMSGNGSKVDPKMIIYSKHDEK